MSRTRRLSSAASALLGALAFGSACAPKPPTPPESTRVYDAKLNPTAAPITVQKSSVDDALAHEDTTEETKPSAPPEPQPTTLEAAPASPTPALPAAAPVPSEKAPKPSPQAAPKCPKGDPCSAEL